MNIPDEVLPCVCGHQKHSHEHTSTGGCFGCVVKLLERIYIDNEAADIDWSNPKDLCHKFVLDNLKLCEIAHNRKEIPFETYRKDMTTKGWKLK